MCAIIQPQQLSLALPSDLFSTGSQMASVPSRFQLSPPAVTAVFVCFRTHSRGVHSGCHCPRSNLLSVAPSLTQLGHIRRPFPLQSRFRASSFSQQRRNTDVGWTSLTAHQPGFEETARASGPSAIGRQRHVPALAIVFVRCRTQLQGAHSGRHYNRSDLLSDAPCLPSAGHVRGPFPVQSRPHTSFSPICHQMLTLSGSC